MAIFNEILTGRFNRALQKLTSIKGGAAVKQLGSEIMPVIQIPLGNEFRYLESWMLFGVATSLGPSAANNPAMRLRNPTGSNTIAVVHKLTFTNQAATATQFNFEGPAPQASDLAGNQTASVTRFDARGNQNTSLLFSTQQNSPLAGMPGANTPAIIMLAGNSSWDLIMDPIHEFPLLPGDAFQVRGPAVNTEIAVILWWRERALEESERT